MKIAAPNYTQIPNVVLASMPEMADSELRVVLAVCRETFGWHRENSHLTLSKLTELTGMSKQGVVNGIHLAEERGILHREPDGDGYLYSLEVVNDVDRGCQRSGQGVVNDVDSNSKERRPKEKEPAPANDSEPSREEISALERRLDVYDRWFSRQGTDIRAMRKIVTLCRPLTALLDSLDGDYDAVLKRFLSQTSVEFCQSPGDLHVALKRHREQCRREAAKPKRFEPIWQ